MRKCQRYCATTVSGVHLLGHSIGGAACRGSCACTHPDGIIQPHTVSYRKEGRPIMAQPRGPLADVKVVACSTAQAGTVPYMLMADLGAEVIKVEVPGVGDGSRRAGRMPGFPSTYFETNNRGVQSLTLNLKAA